MAIVPYTPAQVARTAAALLRMDLGIAQLFNRDFESEYGGGRGDTINVRVPAALVARERATRTGAAIVFDDLAESSFQVKIDRHIYSAVKPTDEELTFDLTSFAAQVLAPQTLAVAEAIEQKAISVLQGVTASTTLVFDDTDPTSVFYAARKQLRDMGVPAGNLIAIGGTNVTSILLQDTKLQRVDASGSTAALRDAQVGRVAGFTTYEDNRLNENELVFLHRDGLTLALRAPVVPEGVTFGKSVTQDGWSLRYIRDYDATVLADRSVVDVYMGASTVPLKVRGTNGTINTVTPVLRTVYTP
jgi:hypothetical protein